MLLLGVTTVHHLFPSHPSLLEPSTIYTHLQRINRTKINPPINETEQFCGIKRHYPPTQCQVANKPTNNLLEQDPNRGRDPTVSIWHEALDSQKAVFLVEKDNNMPKFPDNTNK